MVAPVFPYFVNGSCMPCRSQLVNDTMPHEANEKVAQQEGGAYGACPRALHRSTAPGAD